MSAVAADQPATETPLPAGNRPRLVFVGLLALLWAWSIAICVPFWETNPNYSYGWVVPALVLFFLWRRIQSQPPAFWQEISAMPPQRLRLPSLLLAVPALAIFPLEVLRTEYHQSGIVLWGINLTTVGLTLAGAWWLGGRRLFAVVAFPVLFFLTAVPWPAKVEQPLIQNMMIGVAAVVKEILLWLGVPVQTDGAVLHLTKGNVGIVEACSGIRSLQSGLMVCLAVGELLMLTRTRRWVLVGATVGLALFSNLTRTFTLCWYMEKGGEELMHRRHDLVGNIAMYSLYVVIYLAGQWLARNGGGADVWPAPGKENRLGSKLRWLHWRNVPDFRPLFGVSLLMFVVVHGWYYILQAQTRPQTKPQFTVKSGPNVEIQPRDEEVSRRLGADSSENLRFKTPDAPLGMLDAYHSFWKPSAMSKVALHHRPDICMPGSGWTQVGEVKETTVPFDGHPLKFLVFEFERSDLRAVQIWGVWRNGQPVQMDYSQKLTALPEVYHPIPSSRHMMGVELVSCFVPYKSGPAPVELAIKTLPTLFEYQPFAPSDSPATAATR
jgi:exosortase